MILFFGRKYKHVIRYKTIQYNSTEWTNIDFIYLAQLHQSSKDVVRCRGDDYITGKVIPKVYMQWK
jgi:hypothetical protein